MGHISTSTKSRFDKTPAGWLAVGSQINELVNEWARRSDIVTFIGEGAGHGAPACWVPAIAEMEVNVDVAFGEGTDPTYVGDLTDRKVQFDHPVAVGAVLHEAMHAKHTRFDLRSIGDIEDRFEADLIVWFEESRIEARGVKAFPQNRAFLRACALRLVVGDLKESDDFAGRGIKGFSQLMLLSLARVDAGVLKKKDVKIVHDAAEEFFGTKTLRTLRSIWTRAQAHKDDSDWTGLHTLAKEWVKALEESGNDPKDDPNGEGLPDWLKELLQSMMGEGSEEGEGGEGSPGGSGGLLEAMADDTETDAQSEANSQAVREVMEAIAEAKNAAAAEAKEHSDTSSEVFGRGTGPGPAYTSSALVEERMPTDNERRAAVALSKALERARYRDRVVTKQTSVIPPGRLSARRALAATEQRSRSAEITAEPWSRKVRKHTEDPNLTVGVLVDISGSMGMAMEPMASTAWILSEATRRVQGKCAMVYYGNDVFPVLKAGQHLEQVKVYSAPDGTEKFDRAFQAMNGALDLLAESGARLLVICSDLYYGGWEKERTLYWMERCRRNGIAVVVVPFDYEENAIEVVKKVKGGGVEVVPHALTSRDIVGAAKSIGEAAVRQLANVSQ